MPLVHLLSVESPKKTSVTEKSGENLPISWIPINLNELLVHSFAVYFHATMTIILRIINFIYSGRERCDVVRRWGVASFTMRWSESISLVSRCSTAWWWCPFWRIYPRRSFMYCCDALTHARQRALKKTVNYGDNLNVIYYDHEWTNMYQAQLPRKILANIMEKRFSVQCTPVADVTSKKTHQKLKS